jgi:hypothetical protein
VLERVASVSRTVLRNGVGVPWVDSWVSECHLGDKIRLDHAPSAAMGLFGRILQCALATMSVTAQTYRQHAEG